MRAVFAILTLLAVAGNASAQDEGGEAAPESKLSVHGFLTQAYARADDRQVLGIPEDGTSDYRTGALQVRYAMSPKDTFVIQLSHDRLGKSPLQEQKPKADVDLDWAFYQRALPGELSVRVGRIKQPIGLYNEIRDVGTLLPFYRPPTPIYFEGAFATETLDGFSLSRNFPLGGAWALGADAYFGEWKFLQGGEDPPADVKNAVGGQLWLTTPVSGLRVGLGGWTANVTNFGGALEGDPDRWKIWQASAEGTIKSRLRLAGEYVHVTFPPGGYRAGFVLAALKATDKLTLNVQREWAKLDFLIVVSPQFSLDLHDDYDDNWVAGISYAFRPDVVAKVERHWAEGYLGENPVAEITDPASKTNYTIASLSVSF